MYKTALWIAIILVATFEAFGQSALALAQKATAARTTTYGGMRPAAWISLGILCYAAVAYGLYFSYKYKGVGMVNALWSSLSIILMLTIGYFFFHERLTTYEWIGIAFIITGVTITQVAHSAAVRAPQ